jgi:hypothetical protein
MKYKSLVSLFVSLLVVSSLFAQDDWAKYKPRGLKKIIAVYAEASFKNPEYRDLYATEFLFTEGSVAYWLPVQKQLIPYFEQELKKGDKVNLYVVWVGGRKESGTIEHVFSVNDFEKPGNSQ